MEKRFFGLSGMPRSGSTLLSAILSQNPNIHSEGLSSLVGIMQDTIKSCETYHSNFLINNNFTREFDLVSSIPSIYYKNVDSPIIIDKNRYWTHQKQMSIMKTYITKNPKVVVLERPLIDVLKSYVNIAHKNSDYSKILTLLDDDSAPIMSSLNGIRYAKARNTGEYLFVQYDNLITNTEETIKQIYEFYEIEPFNHYFDNIVVKHPENDFLYTLFTDVNHEGMHDVRPTISKRHIDIELPEDIIRKCEMLDIK